MFIIISYISINPCWYNSDQVEAGVYSTKRVASFLRRYCTMEEEHARV